MAYYNHLRRRRSLGRRTPADVYGLAASLSEKKALVTPVRTGILETGGDPVLSVLRYVERNALRAGLVTGAERWPWSSMHQRTREPDTDDVRPPLRVPPSGLPADWLDHVNRPQTNEELSMLRRCIARGVPFGREAWVKRMAKAWGLESTLRPRGRPRKIL